MEEGEKTRHHSTFAACSAILLMISILTLIVSHFFGRFGPVWMSVVTSILAALFTAAALKFVSLASTTKGISHPASRDYYLTVFRYSAVGCSCISVGVCLRYVAYAGLHIPAALVLAGILEVAGISAVCYAGTLVSPDGLTGMDK